MCERRAGEQRKIIMNTGKTDQEGRKSEERHTGIYKRYTESAEGKKEETLTVFGQDEEKNRTK